MNSYVLKSPENGGEITIKAELPSMPKHILMRNVPDDQIDPDFVAFMDGSYSNWRLMCGKNTLTVVTGELLGTDQVILYEGRHYEHFI